MVKRKSSKFLTGFLILVMIVSILPIGMFTTAFAAEIKSYAVCLTDGTNVLDLDDVNITLTNKDDNTITKTVATTDGIATFENFVTEEATYICSVDTILGYEDVITSEFTVAVDEISSEIILTAIDKVNVSGIVTDENGDPYEGAMIAVSGYITTETETNEYGEYSFGTYSGKENTVTISTKEEKYNTIPSTAIYNADATDVNYQLSVKTFNIVTKADENGTITSNEEDVPYGDSKNIEITANTGYRIEEVKVSTSVNTSVVAEAAGQRNYTLHLNNITENYDITVSFYQMTYKVIFTVGDNGEVTYGEGETDTIAGGSINVEKVFEESTDSDNPTTVKITATPSENYRVSKVKVDSKETTYDDNNYIYETELEMTENHTFEVEFSINEYTLEVESGNNGSASWGTDGTETIVKHGESAMLNITPDDGYAVETVTINGVEAIATEDESSIYIAFDRITENTKVVITYAKPDETNPDEKLANKYYEITFSDAQVKDAYMDGDTYVVVLPNDATATLTPINPYTGIKYNASSANYNYKDSITISKTTLIKNIYVKKGVFSGDKQYITVNVKIIIDKVAPVVEDIDEPNWTNQDTVTIAGKVSDAQDSSGLNYIVWSKDNALVADEVLNATENKVAITDGSYTFTGVKGEQNSIYYVYAVDYAGNVSVAKTVVIKIDQKVPTVTAFTFSTDENSVIENLINFATFGTICKEKMYVTVSAADEEISSGIKEISLYYGSILLGTKNATNNAATFELTETNFHEDTEIYAVVTDIAGNVSVNTKPTDDGIIASANSDKVQIATDKPTATITPETEVYTDSNGNLWYNGNVEFTVNVNDDVTGVRTVVIKMNGEELKNDMNNIDLTQDFSKGDEKDTTETFVINTSQNAVDGLNRIEVVVTNAAGVESIVYTQDVYIDTTNANIIGYEITTINDSPLDKVLNFLTFGIFFNEQVKITVTAEDVNASAGVKTITLYVDDEEFATQSVDENNKTTFTVPAGELAENSVYAADISAIATDNVGNVTSEAVIPTTVNSNIKDTSLMLENVAPTVNVTFAAAAIDKNEATKDNNDWYASDVEFTVTASDVNSGIRNVTITINDTELVNVNYYNDEGTDTETYEEVYTISTANVARAEDGSYTIKVSVTDNAGNVNNNYSKTIYKDIDKPYITGFDFEPTEYIEGSEKATTVEVTDYGFYFKEDTNVIISANDVAPTAGIKSITYYTVDYTNNSTGIKSEEKTVLVDAEDKITITIAANFKGQIYAKATDNVLNVTDAFVNPNSAIIESAAKHEEETHISFAKAETKYTANDGTELYNSSVDVEITVTDTYSGIREIEWSVVAPYDTENNKSGKVILNNDKTIVEGTENDWEQTQTEVNLVTEMKKTITVVNNSNNIVVKVKMTDRAGNTSEEEIEFSIDTTAPVIAIEYDNNTSDETYADIYKDNRTATITVIERNFKAEDVVYAITNTDGIIPTLSSWNEYKNIESPDDSYYTATIAYTADGDYTFDISYADLTANPANVVAQHVFTIDKTIPVVTVVYDNNSALNGNYYKSERTATITIKEHNFDSARVSVIGVATDNGVTFNFPTISSWKDSGNDTYTATIAYTADAKYSFDIEFLDKAGNSITDYTTEEFYVDKTAPSLEITGIADKSANNGDIIPIITYSDTNFNKDNVTITLVGVNNGKVEYSGSYADITNGQTYTYANFEQVKSVDDIYTLTVALTDFAGNETTMTISFSVNRYGSVYDLSKVESIISKYLQNEQDIVFTETNVDSLDREGIIVKFTKNGTPTTLVEGTDYTVDVNGGNGEWSVYTYTISKDLFADDGTYSISIYSVDAAGNINENIDESKKAEIVFGIDKTAPVIVPIDLESGRQYPVEGKTASIEIKDNLVLEKVKIYLNGEEIEYTVDDETYTFFIPESNSVQAVKIVATDSAGNEYEFNVEGFLVSTNIFVRWYNNTPLFVGSIIGVVVLILGIAIFIIFGKKKKEDKEK